MQNQRVPRLENKSTRRKMNLRIQSLVKKSVELSTQYDCEILLIVYNQSKSNWLEYCSSDASRLFFGYQTAKEHLEQIELYDNTNYNKLLKNITSPETSLSPRPMKCAKISEQYECFSQPIKIVEKASDSFLSSLSTRCTNNIVNSEEIEIVPPKINQNCKLTHADSSVGYQKSLDECDSSPDFNFEDYFEANNNT